uniref:Rho-GAP domain-containing protein n=1 Tax=Rhabditophanes sp. KR3021 TaxID=114890 RepID=A0AC35TZN2_9BILA
MRDKVKARAPSTFGKSATILSMNPLGSLVVNDDGYYSHSPDPSKRPNPSSLKKHPTISRPSLTYHESFVSPINFKTNKIDTPRLRRECGWIPSTLRVSPSLLSESSDDRESSTCTDLTETIYDFHLLNQSVSSMNYLVETSSSCLSSLLERYSNARLVNAKKMTLISYNIRKIFSHSKASTKGSSLDFQVKKLDKIPTCFGMCLSDVQVFCEGETLPKCIHEMMTFLLEHGPTTDGIFRKNGVRSRIETLKNKCISVSPKDLVFYTENGNCLLDGSQVHDIADTLKQYFRELPGKLFTEKLSEFFVAITSYLPADKQKEALRYGILLMDDVHRYAALTLFSFLHKICSWSEENNMSAENLAVCFTPSLFHLNTESEKDTSISNFRLKRRKTIAMPSEQELKEYQSAQKALALMIRHYDELYTLPKDISRQIAVRNPFYVATLYKEPCINIQNLKPRSIEQCRLQLKEMIFQTVNDYGLDWASWTFDQDFCGSTIYYRKMQNSLPLIRISITIQATPHVIWNVLYNKKKVWQSQVSYTNTITNISSESDLQVVGYKKYAEQEAFAKKVLLFRTWRKDSPELQGGCLLGERSVKDCDLIKANPSNVFPDIITSCFLIMPNPDGISSRLNYIHRSDIKGHTSTYYNKTYPRIIANQIVQLSNYFSNPFIAATQYPLRASESEV